MSPLAITVIAGLIVLAVGAVTGALALGLVTTICRVWVWTLTLGLPAELKARRRGEVRSDLHEQRVDALANGYSPQHIAIFIFVRWVCGIPSDIVWRLACLQSNPLVLLGSGVLTGGVLVVSLDGTLTLTVIRGMILLLAGLLLAFVSMTPFRRHEVRYRTRPEERPKPHIDRLLAFSIVGLLVVGLAFLASTPSGSQLIWKQSAAVVIGSMLLFVVVRFDYRLLRMLCVPGLFWTLTALLLLFTPMGADVGGVRRSLNLGAAVQPTELAKLSVLIYVSAWLTSRGPDINKFSLGFVPVTILLATVGALVTAQPDLGGALVLSLSIATLFYMSRAPLSHLALVLGAAALLSAAVVATAGHYYGYVAVTDWREASRHYLDAIAGSGATGGAFGGGETFVSVQHDGLFAWVGEQAGLAGMALIVGLYGLLIYRGVVVSWRAVDQFGKILGVGITALIGYQALLNLAGVVGLIPLTGEGLPLVSYGYAEIIPEMVAVGILFRIARDSSAPPRVIRWWDSPNPFDPLTAATI